MPTPHNNIDLLPESIRLRCQQGLRMGRYIAAVTIACVVVITLATHSRIELERTRDRYLKARATADEVLRTETRAAMIRTSLAEHERLIAMHNALAWPVRVTSLMSTLVNRMPPSVSLDRLELTAQTNRPSGQTSTARRTSPDQPLPEQRIVRGELSGFAQSDSDISTLIHALEHTQPLSEISLDYSRTKTVRGQPAREFRLSFRIDLDSVYEPQDASVARAVVGDSLLLIGDDAKTPNTQHQAPNTKHQTPLLTGVTDAG